jgi:succinate dehydrogenase hydrophobic anchor subunit
MNRKYKINKLKNYFWQGVTGLVLLYLAIWHGYALAFSMFALFYGMLHIAFPHPENENEELNR